MQLQVETQIYKKDAIKSAITEAGSKANHYITLLNDKFGIRVHGKYNPDDPNAQPYSSFVQINSDDISMWRANQEKMRLDSGALKFYTYNGSNNESQHLLASYGDGLVLYKPGVGSGADTPVVSINSSGANIDGSVTIGGKIQGDYLNSNIQVGGNNLLIGTAASVSKSTTATTSYVTQALYSTSDLKMLSELGFSIDDEITLSFDWKITSASTYGNARIEWYGKTDSSDNTYIAPLISPFATFSASKTSGHVEKTVKLTSATIQAKRLVLRIDNSNLTLTISNLKLEKGNKATSWSPAPEDLEKSYYGNCETAAATADKQVSCAGFNLKTGAIVGIKFTNGNTCESNITLNINGTGAKTVYFLGQTTGTDSRLNVSLAANAVVSVIYDGTYWRILSIDQTSTMVTRIGDNGISIHPSGTTQHRVEINSSGMNVYRNNTSIAEYGTNARIGSANGQRFLINAGSLQAYDSNSNMYFEVSSAGIKFGQNIQVATTGDIPTKVSELDNDEDYVTNSEMEGSIQKAKGNYTILWNYEAFGTANNGEAFICKLDGLSNTASDSNGTVVWNGIERTITKQMVNPNTIAPYNIPIYIVCRLSNASATTATNYMVWYNDGWKYAICPTPSAIGGNWTWDNSRDIIIGKFVETGSEVALVEYEVYNPPLNSKQLTTINTTASSAAQTATNYLSFDSSNGLRIAQSTSDFSKPYVQITSNGVKTIYNNNYFTNLTSSGLNIHAGHETNPIATYGATIVFFEPGTTTKAAEITSSGINIKAGTIKLGEYFEVSTTGALTAKSGTVGGWNISTTGLCSATTYTPANGRILLAPAGVSSTTSIGGSTGTQTWGMTVGTGFGVTTGGKLYATDAIISGTMTIGSGSTIDTNATVGGTSMSTIKSNASNGASAYNNGIKSTVSCYYRKENTAPTQPTSSTSIGTSATTSDAWEYVMPQPKRNCTFYTCEEYTPVTGNKTYSTMRELSSETYASKWVSSSDNTYIDGGRLYTNSVTADQISVNNLSALSANMGELTSGTIKYGTVGSNNSFYLSNADTSAAIGGQTSAVSGLRLTVGSGFGVTSAGKLYATGAVISGALTATSLTIGSTNYASYIQNLPTNTTEYVKTAKGAAEKTATNYIGISGNGIKVAASSPTSATNYVEINSGSVNIVADSNHKTVIDSNGMYIYAGDSTNSVAQFGDTVRIGKSSTNNIEMDGNSFILYDDDSYQQFSVQQTGATTTDTTTVPVYLSSQTETFTRTYTLPRLLQSVTIYATPNSGSTESVTMTLPSAVGGSTSSTLCSGIVTCTLKKTSSIRYRLTIKKTSGALRGLFYRYTSQKKVARVTVGGFNMGIIPGDEIYIDYEGAGFLTNSSKDIHITIPINKPIFATVVDTDTPVLITRQNSKYTHGSSASEYVDWTTNVAAITECGVYLELTRNTTTNSVNNAPIGVDIGITLTFS